MKLEELEEKLSKYYDTLINPSYVIDNWTIVNNPIYKKWKNKLKIETIRCYNNNIKIGVNEIIVLFETKKELIVIKYNDKFISFRESETEYGLITDNYDLFAVNINNMNLLETAPIESFNNICKQMNWKLSKRAKEFLDYFED